MGSTAVLMRITGRGSNPRMEASVPEGVFELYFDSQVAVGSVFTLHAHLEHAGVAAACREGKDGKDLQVGRGPDGTRGEKKNIRTYTDPCLSIVVRTFIPQLLTIQLTPPNSTLKPC